MRRVLSLVLLLAISAAAQRLPGNVVPDNYKLYFDPDLNAATFLGRAEIAVRVLKPTDTVVLHALNLRIEEAAIEQGGTSQKAAVSEVSGVEEQVALKVSTPLGLGAATIKLRYTGRLDQDMRGIYVSRTGKRAYLASQMEATDARRAFPSFDEPAYKATFDVSVAVDANDTAISNGRVIGEKQIQGGRKLVTFATTPKMSSYLVALTVGDFQCLSDEADGIPLRVCGVPERAKLLQFAMDATKFVLPWYNRYYGVKYPFGKLDQVAVPDFGPGAMENAGAILYRESALLADDSTPQDAKKAIAATISHEIAHQWFGNLVTMKWWDDIWLNEGFASWITSKPLKAWKPEWKLEVDDARDAVRAMRNDSLQSTRAIRTNAETSAEIWELFDGIAYGKTAAVLRMIEAYAGEEEFRKAIADYIKKYSYSNAQAEDFWATLAQSTGKPLNTIMQSYALQPGVPAIVLYDQCDTTSGILVAQARFRFIPQKGRQLWVTPVCTGSGAERSCSVVDPSVTRMKAPSCELSLMPNSGGTGYYRAGYSDKRAEALRNAAKSFTAEERVWLLDNEWATALAGTAQIGRYLALVGEVSAQPERNTWELAAEGLERLHEYVVRPEDRPNFEAWVRNTFSPKPNAALIEGVEGEQIGVLRLRILAMAGGDHESVGKAKLMASSFLNDAASVRPEQVSFALTVAAQHGDSALYDRYLAALRKPQPPATYRSLLEGMGWFRDPALVKRTIDLALSPEIRPQDAGTLLTLPMIATAGSQSTWELLKANWDAIGNKLGDRRGAVLAEATAAMCGADAERDVREFFAAHPAPGAERTIKQSLEAIAVCTNFRKRQSAGGRGLRGKASLGDGGSPYQRPTTNYQYRCS